jgi:hypothetical protein
MKQQEIIDGNKLIAEFIEMENVIYGDTGVTYYKNNIPYQTFKLEFHSSWDWLIPIMQKIGTLGFMVTLEFDEKPYLTYISIKDNSTATYIDEDYEDRDYEIESDIHLAWFNVVNFIKWYNKQEHE